MYPAEFGGKASALINVVTKSGGNAFHGSALEFVRNETLRCAQLSSTIRPSRFRRCARISSALNVGGPLARDRDVLLLQLRRAADRKAQTQTFSVPTAALRAGDFSGAGAALRSADAHGGRRARRLPAIRFRPIASSPVALALLAKVPLPTSAGLVQNLLGVEDQDNPMNQFSVRARSSAVGRTTRCSAASPTYRVSDAQPFGTSSLNEALVPGFGRIVTTKSENLALGHTHAFGIDWLNEVRFGYLDAPAADRSSPNQGVELRRRVRPAGRHHGSARHGLSAGLVRRSVQHDRRSDVVRLAREPQLRAVRQRDGRSRRPPPEVRRLSVPPARSIRSIPTQRARQLHVQRPVDRQRVRRFPARLSRASSQVGIGRADEHGRSTWFHVYGQDDWKVRAEPDAQLRAALRDQQPDDRRRQSAVGDRPHRAGRTLRDRQRRRTATSRRAARRCCRRFRFPTRRRRTPAGRAGLLRPSYLRFAPRLGVGVVAGRRRQDRRQRRLRRVPESVGLQRAAGARATLPFFFAKTVTAAADALQPTHSTETDAAGAGQRHRRRQHDGLGFPDRVREELLASRCSASWHADDARRGQLPALGDRRRRQLHRAATCPSLAPAPSVRAGPSRSLRNITAIRWDGYSIFNGVTFSASSGCRGRAVVLGELHAVEGDRRCVGSRRRRRSKRTCRRTSATWPPSERVASFDHRHRFVGSVTYALPDFGGSGCGRAGSAGR